MVTDYDCWHDEHEQVDVAQVIACMTVNAAKAKAMVSALAGALTGARPASPIDTTLDTAIITAPTPRSADGRKAGRGGGPRPGRLLVPVKFTLFSAHPGECRDPDHIEQTMLRTIVRPMDQPSPAW